MKIQTKAKKFKEKIKKNLRKFYKDKKEAKDLEKLDAKLKILSQQDKKSEAKDRLIRSNKSMFRFWFAWLVIVWLGFFVYQTIDIIFLVFMALIIAIAIEAVIDFFQKRLHRGISVGLTYLLLLLFVLWWLIFIIPFIAEQVSAVLQLFVVKAQWLQTALADKTLPQLIQNISWLPKYAKTSILTWLQDPTFYTRIQGDLQKNLTDIIGTSTTYAKEIGSVAFNFFSWVAWTIGKGAIVLTLSVLFSIEKEAVIKFIAGLAWHKKREYLEIKVKRIYKKLWLWLKGQLLLCLFIWLAVFIALLTMSAFGLDIPQKWSLALIAWLTELIPYLWPLLWGILAVLVVGLHNGFPAVLITIWVFIVIQRAENNILVPVVMNKTLGMNPVVIFLSILVWWLVMWFAGVLLAVPIAVVVTMFLDNSVE